MNSLQLSQLKEDFPQFQNPLFLQELLHVAVYKHLPVTTTLLHRGDNIKGIPLVLKGSIRVLRQDVSGKDILLYHIAAGQSCIMSFLACKRACKSEVWAITDEDTDILFVPAQFVNMWQKQFNDWNDFLLALYHQRFEELIHVVQELAFSRVDERMITLLKTKAQLQKSETLKITHQQIADELGTAREVVSRLLKQLEQAQKLQLGRGQIRLLQLM